MAEPKVRFKRDDGSSYPAWKTSSFSETFIALNNNTYSRDMLNYIGGDAKNIHYGDILVKFGDICDIQKDIIPYVNEGLAIQKYTSLKDGDIILADTAEDETVGKAVEIYNTKNDVVISGLHTMVCRPVNSFAPKYLGYCMNSPAFHNQLRPFMQGVKVTSIGRSNISEVEISSPSSIEEQQKIADFLSSVDEVITASKEEVANLETQKKAVMKKLFSQEVRFKRADGSDFPKWEEKPLECIIKVIIDNRGKTPPLSKSGYPLIEISAVGDYYLRYEKIEKWVNQETYDNWFRKHLENGDLLFSTVGNTAQCSVYDEKEKCCVAQNIIGIRFDENTDSRFMFNVLTYEQNQKLIKSIQMNGVQPSVKVSQLIKLSFSIASLEEQCLIADFLSDFDEAIAAAKKELELWKELKKGLLQQMFV